MKINYFNTLIFFQAFKKENEGIMRLSIKFIKIHSLYFLTACFGLKEQEWMK